MLVYFNDSNYIIKRLMRGYIRKNYIYYIIYNYVSDILICLKLMII